VMFSKDVCGWVGWFGFCDDSVWVFDAVKHVCDDGVV
jgi:hypothetical protein